MLEKAKAFWEEWHWLNRKEREEQSLTMLAALLQSVADEAIDKEKQIFE